MFKLRDYQERTLAELYEWLQRHPQGNPIVDACVGAGKSVIIAEFCKRAIAQYPQTRIVMCVQSKELCQQNLEKLKAIWPEAPAGVCSASLGGKDLSSQIIFATIGSIAKKAHLMGTVNLLIIDECHNVNPDNAGMYRNFINDLKKYGNQFLCVIGFTGTPFRGDGVWLWQGEDPLFEGTATHVTMDELLEKGYLSPLVVDHSTPETIDTSNTKIARGDYVVKELEEKLIDPAIISATVTDLMQRGKSRKKWLVFCVTIDHAEMVFSELVMNGIDASIVTSRTKKSHREKRIESFKSLSPDSLRCLVNVACLTTGFDAPSTDLIALLRPTRSPVLYVQIAGRGMRIANGKDDCLWLDYTSTTRELGAVNRIKGRNKISKNTEQGAPFKYCPECGNKNPIHKEVCIECGAEIPTESNDPHTTKAGSSVVLAGYQEPEQEWFDITHIGFYKHHGKNGKPPTLRIEYDFSEIHDPIKEYKCFEHDGFALRMGCQWWIEHVPSAGIPISVDESVEVIHEQIQVGGVKLPSRILCQKTDDGKYWRVKKYEYEQSENIVVTSDKPVVQQSLLNTTIVPVAKKELPF